MVFVEVVEHHLWVLSLQYSIQKGDRKEVGWTTSGKALLSNHQHSYNSGRERKNITPSTLRKWTLRMQRPYPKVIEANGKHICWFGQKIKHIKTFWVKLLGEKSNFLALFPHSNWYWQAAAVWFSGTFQFAHLKVYRKHLSDVCNSKWRLICQNIINFK